MSAGAISSGPVPVPRPPIQDAFRHFEAGRLAEAEALCQEALRADPENAQFLHLYGLVAFRLGKSSVALDAMENAARLDPSNYALANNLAQTYRVLGRLGDAESACLKALALKPDYLEANCTLATVLEALGRSEQAAQAYFAAGAAAYLLGRSAEAVACNQKALALRPDFAEAHGNLGNVLKDLGQYEEAEKSFRRALALRSDFAGAWTNLGLLCQQLNRLEEAERSCLEALRLEPGLAHANLLHAHLLLLRGNYASGLALLESRFQTGLPWPLTVLRERLAQLEGMPRWQGEDIAGRVLLVWTDQGLGDSLMAMRYLPRLKERGAGKVVVYCEPELVRVVRTVAGVDAAISRAQPLPSGEFDCHCPIMSLPLLFDTRLDSIPADVPYLRVPEKSGAAWSARLGEIASPRVGLAWAGGKVFRLDALRSIRLKHFSPVLEVAGINFVSLQKGEEADQLKHAPRRVFDCMDQCEDILDTAALMQHLDLVISVDTSVAHLAGALGKPVWLLNRFESEWRWMLDREDSPWYPTMRIFRQSRMGDWDEVMARVALALRKHPLRRGAGVWLDRLLGR